jgi:hypothetical protein
LVKVSENGKGFVKKNPPSPLLSPILHKDDISISFLPVESSDFVLGCSGITTTTFYESSDIQSAKFFLDTRVKHLLKLNPWLTGRLTNQNKQKKLQLIYNPNLDSVNIEHFLKFETTNKRVDESLDYESICNHLSKYTLRKGALSVNKDLSEEPLFRITMLQTSINRFALIMSLCHVIGDGATYYELYAMLHKDTEPRALNAIRKDSSQYETAANLLMNHRYTEWNEWLFSFSSVIQCVYTVIFGPIPKSITVAISNSWIKHQKNKYKDEMVGKDKTSISFISTNDIVTSYLAKLAGYDVILMAANFRGKLSLVNNNDAGNYETLICYNKENMSPMQIRQSIIIQYLFI